MKRFISLLLSVSIVLSMLFVLTLGASATELKTGIGTVTAKSGLRLREKASSTASTICTAYYGDQVVIIRKTGDWYLVNYNLHIGYMHADYITVKENADINLGSGSMDSYLTNVRSTPSTSSTVVDKLNCGEKVNVIGFNNGWYKVRYDDITGYVRSDLVTLLEKPANNQGTAKSSSGSSNSTGSSTGNLGQKIANYAKTFVGYPYVYGGSSPSGFDCSGFVQYIYKQYGISLNRTATSQLKNGYSVSYADMKPGDIIYFGYGNTATHVGIYIGNGNFVHAENWSTGVVITSLSQSYYANRYLCTRRIVE